MKRWQTRHRHQSGRVEPTPAAPHANDEPIERALELAVLVGMLDNVLADAAM